MKSTTITIALSAAAVLGYLSYRALTPVPMPVVVPVAPPPAAATTEATEAPQSDKLVENLPEFSLQNLAEQPQSIHSWPGKALLINFWATWCPPCLREIPLLKEFQKTHGDGPIQIVGIAVDRQAAVAKFATTMQFNYPILIGQSEAMDAAAAFGVDFVGLPFSVFTDPEGHVLGVHTGELRAEHLEQLATMITALRDGTTTLAAARATLAGRQ
jgi:thiol-disulfide isomerase/thioredoxin